jgi:hypothetical protein
VAPKSVAPSAAPGLAPAALRAVGAALLGAGIWIGLAGPFGVTWGLVAVALFVGWLIGSVTRSPTGHSEPRVRAIAAAGGALAWLLALAGVYVYLSAQPSGPAQAGALVGSLSIIDYYAQNLGLLDVIEGVLLVLAAWWSAR